MYNLYLIGDLTLQGYNKKKRQLYVELDELCPAMSAAASEGSTSTAGSSSSAIAACNVLAKSNEESVHSTLMKLFRPGTDFNPSSVPAKASKGHNKSLKLARKGSNTTKADIKTITVINVSSNSLSIPTNKEKLKLRSERKMSFIDLSPDNQHEDIVRNIRKAFSKDDSEMIVFLQATQSGDLFESKMDSFDGESVLKLVKGGCLYFQFRSSVSPVQKSGTVDPGATKPKNSGPIQVIVRPIVPSKPTSRGKQSDSF